MNDTIIANQQVIDEFQSDGAYDYARELVPDHSANLYEKIVDEGFEHVSQDTHTLETTFNSELVLWILGVVALLLLAWLLWHARFKLFMKEEKAEDDYEVSLDDIHELDLDQLITEMRSQGNHLGLCRLLYLRTLKVVSDAGLVDWQRYKTPTQYAQELGDPDFRTMTNHFLRVRYGKFGADQSLSQEMEQLGERVAVLARAHNEKTQSPEQQVAAEDHDGEKGGNA